MEADQGDQNKVAQYKGKIDKINAELTKLNHSKAAVDKAFGQIQAKKAKEVENKRLRTFADAKNNANQHKAAVKSLNSQISKLKAYHLTLKDAKPKEKAEAKLADLEAALETAKTAASSASVKYAKLNSNHADGKI